jgi:uncharacterized membrane protein YphA (DoxX/SURF4 family)
MERLTKAGQVFFGICIAGHGIQQFIYPGFRPVLIPEWPTWMPGSLSFWVYLTGAMLTLAGVAILVGWKGRTVSLYTGMLLLLLLLVFHLPHRFNNSPEILGAWTNALKLLALAGGAFVATTTFGRNTETSLSATGRVFFSLMLIPFGIEHFLYVDFVKTLVPAWIPGDTFWTYFSAVALIGSGLALLVRIKTRLVALLLGGMLLLWLILLHIPRAIEYPSMDNGNELTSVFQALGFSGIAFMIAGIYSTGSPYPSKDRS